MSLVLDPENVMRQACPICCENMFTSIRQVHVLKCGHTLHAVSKEGGWPPHRRGVRPPNPTRFSAFLRPFQKVHDILHICTFQPKKKT